MAQKGLFITFEGPDGSGKSTQIRLLKEALEEKGIPVFLTREPGGTPISEKIRTIILDKENGAMDPMAEALLYAASRAQLLGEWLRPAMERGETVICDRYVDSSIAYQGYGRGLGPDVEAINRIATGGLLPDLTFLVSLSPEKAMERIAHRADPSLDRLELEKAEFRQKVYEGYLDLAKRFPDRICLIDGSGTVEEIAAAIWKRTEALYHEN